MSNQLLNPHPARFISIIVFLVHINAKCLRGGFQYSLETLQLVPSFKVFSTFRYSLCAIHHTSAFHVDLILCFDFVFSWFSLLWSCLAACRLIFDWLQDIVYGKMAGILWGSESQYHPENISYVLFFFFQQEVFIEMVCPHAIRGWVGVKLGFGVCEGWSFSGSLFSGVLNESLCLECPSCWSRILSCFWQGVYWETSSFTHWWKWKNPSSVLE